MELKIKQETLQAIMNYLGTKPFVEVAGMIQQIQKEVAEQTKNKE